MVVGFSKLFADIIHSTVWREPMHVKVVWITMLAMADRHGQVMASIPGLADCAKVSLEECLEALNVFLSPDPYSRTKDYEGRRIVEIDGGWLLLNYEKFRERRDDEEQRLQTRDRVRRHRANAASLSNVVTESVTVTPSNDIQKQSTDTEAKSIKNINVQSVFENWAKVLNHPQAKCDEKRKRIINARLKEGFTVEQLLLVPHGVKNSSYHMGENPDKRVYDGIQTIYRDAEQVEKFIQLSKGSKTIGCDICLNHPHRAELSVKTGGYIFDPINKIAKRCTCNGTA